MFYRTAADASLRDEPSRVVPAREYAPVYEDGDVAPKTERYLPDVDEDLRDAPRTKISALTGSSKDGKGRLIKQVFNGFDLSVARVDGASPYTIRLDGNILVYNDSTLGTDRIQVRMARFDGDTSAPLLTLRPGQEVGGDDYAIVLISNAAIAGSKAELWIVGDERAGFTYK